MIACVHLNTGFFYGQEIKKTTLKKVVLVWWSISESNR